jgi:hypothetical protein
MKICLTCNAYDIPEGWVGGTEAAVGIAAQAPDAAAVALAFASVAPVASAASVASLASGRATNRRSADENMLDMQPMRGQTMRKCFDMQPIGGQTMIICLTCNQ